MDYGTLWQVAVTLAGISGTWAVTRREASEARKEAEKALTVAQAAHVRIDKHSERIVGLERDGIHAEKGLNEIKSSLQALHKRLDEWFDGRRRDMEER